VFHAGDVFDRRKYVNFNILDSVQKHYIDPIVENDIEVVTTVGNHDVYWKNTNNVNSVNQLFGAHKNFKVFTEPTYVKFDGLDVLLMPWINGENHEKAMSMIANSKANILMGHLEIQGFYYYRGGKCETGLDKKIFKNFDMVLSGHFHHRHDDGTIFYLGCPYEMTYADLNDPKGFHVFDTEKLTLKFIQNPNKMFHKIYYDDRNKTFDELVGKSKLNKFAKRYVKVVVSHKTDPYIFDQFIEKMYQVGPANISIVENYVIDDTSDGDIMSQDTLTILQNYVDCIDTNGLDKGKMKDIVRNLYLEASSMDNTVAVND
jgi:DNA repair exonuclease SbcCD nuclease subunit